MNKVFIVAEAGVNHNGNLNWAHRMIEVASDARADAIKFQTFKTGNLVASDAPMADYQKKAMVGAGSQAEMLKRYELDGEAHRVLMEHCRQKAIMFLSTPFDLESVGLLYHLGLQIFKIPSGEITNLPLLRCIGNLGKRVLLSTGMATMEEIGAAMRVLTGQGTIKEHITVLHCTTEYPAPMEAVNLKAMLAIGGAFNVAVGYSDHTLGIEVPIAAVALGATVIEKHFTLDRRLEGPDHRASLEPRELQAMVEGIRNIERALGDGVKAPSAAELKNRPTARKSIVAARAITKGELLTDRNVTTKRPGSGISPMEWDSVVGRRAQKDFREAEPITL